MRGSRIFAGLVIIALVAIALIYLEDHGYFKNPKVAPLGVFKSDETAPRPEPPPEADQPAPAATPSSQPATTATVPANKPSATNEAVTSAPQAAMNQPMTAANSRTQYVDAQGNVCRPIQVPRPVAAQATTPHPHHYRTRQAGWTYAPRSSRVSTPCGVIRQTATGQRVVNLQAGMILNVGLDRDLGTGTGPDAAAPGQEFSGFLIGPITYCGEVIVPAGAPVEGTVVSSRRHSLMQEDDAILALRISVLDANGYRIPLAASSYNRRMYGEVPYKTVNYMNDPNYVATSHTSNHDVMLPAHSVVTFYLQAPAPVYF